ncbi:MAG: hypothetical protein WC635_05435 [Bacteriovorax sp.]|jgi:hypothetical protein
MKSENTEIESALEVYLAKWMIEDSARNNGIKRLPKKQQAEIFKRAEKIIETSKRNKTLRVYEINNVPVALVARVPSSSPRIKNQQGLFFICDKKARKIATPWIQRQLRELGSISPRYTTTGIPYKEDIHYRKILTKAGFLTRYEILEGNTKIALANLIKEKNPSDNLAHLGLDITEISTQKQIKEAMKLQKIVGTKYKGHTYFSHTKTQLQKDKKEYVGIIANKNGLLLGVYREKKLLGLMMAGMYGSKSPSKCMGGFSFFLHPTIQGLGVTKTGYLLLLKFLAKKKVAKFHGGTSQPAIQSLGQIMKRKIQYAVYVKGID